MNNDNSNNNFLRDFHWLIDVLQYIDVGLVILDADYNIQMWNSFMQNHSAVPENKVIGKNIFSCFEELPETWFRHKVQNVFSLHNSAFTTWEQRPYLFRFKNNRPITGQAEFMYQNSTIIPLKDSSDRVEKICLIIYDVTEAAINHLHIQKANAELKHMSRSDGLTGLLNRKAWESELSVEINRYSRHGQPSSLVMFDIDHFKKVNDIHGHTAGDEVIRQTATAALECLRDIDIAGRYGGEEFAVILVQTSARGAHVVAERIRKKVESIVISHNNIKIQVTISLGIKELDAQVSDSTQWIDHADKALYQAKSNGRNNSVVHKK